MIRATLLFPIQFIGFLAFLYTVAGGHMVVPPSAIMGLF
ncbi:MAG: hypothetical protein K0R85_148 [Devosia sp.]|jgi:hypothetical protein|nr:hypothetical protein [Devosia sp.]